MDEISKGVVCCRTLDWIFDLCVDRHIDPQRILKYVDWSRQELQDPACFIDWESFLTLFSNLGNYFTEERLFEAGSNCWHYPALRPYLLVGRLLRSTADQYAAMYGNAGVASRLYPLSCAMREVKRGHLEITLCMQYDLTPCRVFQVLLAGQMAGLPSALGEPEAAVHFNHTAQGATYDIWYQPIPGPISLARKLLQRHRSVREGAQALAAAEDELIAQAERIHTSAGKLTETRRRARRFEARCDELEQNSKDVPAESKRAEAELREREAGHLAITGSIRDAIITVDEHNLIIYANPAALRIFESNDAALKGQSLTDLLPAAHRQPASANEAIPIEGLRPDGSPINLQASLVEHPLNGRRHTTWVIRDLTLRNDLEKERERLEQQLHVIQRIDSIGQMTGGIAHDFNNLLVAINGYADLALVEDLTDVQRSQYITEIRRAGVRAADMTHKLLAFSRRKAVEPSLVDVNQLIGDLEKIIVRLLPDNIQVRILPALQRPVIRADPGQIEQILVNLAVNARDAMKGGGLLTLSVDQKNSTAPDFSNTPLLDGEFVVISVEDTGEGMSEDLLEHIFEPFFTTKPEGEGTGLGLAVTSAIIKQCKGHVEVSSKPGMGTRVEIYLPLSASRLPPISREKHKPAPAPTTGTETILLVEDNAAVREIARLILIGAGYTVIEARDGVEALSVCQRQNDRIALAVMDVVMPRMGGEEVMCQLRKIDPDIRILLTSGYSMDGIHTASILEEGWDFIQKPYDAETLRAKVRRVMDGRIRRSPGP